MSYPRNSCRRRFIRSFAPHAYLYSSTPRRKSKAAAPSAIAAYLYRVQSIGNGLLSAPSAFDIAAAIVFTTDPDLIIRAVDWTDMRKGVRALCIAAQINMSQCTFTDALSDGVTQAPLTEIRKVHLMDLRSALNASRLALGLAATGFAEPDPSDVKLSQVDEIRGGVR